MTTKGKILFVCTGNTCRSPMAEGIFLALTHKHPQWDVASAGIAASYGDLASRETLDLLYRRHNIDFSGHGSQPVTEQLIEEATDIFTMTEAHLAILLAHFPQHAGKMHMATEWTTRRDVPDPIGCGKRAYEQVSTVLDDAITAIIQHLTQRNR